VSSFASVFRARVYPAVSMTESIKHKQQKLEGERVFVKRECDLAREEIEEETRNLAKRSDWTGVS
jgi:hypothetical protein